MQKIKIRLMNDSRGHWAGSEGSQTNRRLRRVENAPEIGGIPSPNVNPKMFLVKIPQKRIPADPRRQESHDILGIDRESQSKSMGFPEYRWGYTASRDVWDSYLQEHFENHAARGNLPDFR